MAGARYRCRILRPTGTDTVEWIPDAAVQIGVDGTLEAVGPWTPGELTADLRDGVLTPGFTDAHVHFPQTRIVGAASGPLLEWLTRSTFPEEARFAEEGHADQVARAFTTALAAAGTTLSMVYSSVHEPAADALFKAMSDRGLRGLAGPVLMDEGAPAALLVGADEAVAALERLAERWHGRDGLQLAVLPRFGLTCSMDLMRRAGALASERGLWVSTHLSENLDECRATTDKFGTADYLEVYETAGLLHERSVYAHCIHLSDSEWDRFAAAGAVAAHCPDSNDFLGSGGMPLQQVLSRHIPLALGTDVAAGRSFRVPRIASSAHDNALRFGARQTPATWFSVATLGGARALRYYDTGSLAAGERADMVLHDVPDWVDDAEAALAWLLFHHDAGPARRTWSGGRVVWDRATWPGGLVWDTARG